MTQALCDQCVLPQCETYVANSFRDCEARLVAEHDLLWNEQRVSQGRNKKSGRGSTHCVLAELQPRTEAAQVLEERVVRMDLDFAAEVRAHFVVYLARVDEKNSAILRDHSVGEKNRVEADVRAAQVEQPRDLVQHADNHGFVVLLIQLFS